MQTTVPDVVLLVVVLIQGLGGGSIGWKTSRIRKEVDRCVDGAKRLGHASTAEYESIWSPLSRQRHDWGVGSGLRQVVSRAETPYAALPHQYQTLEHPTTLVNLQLSVSSHPQRRQSEPYFRHGAGCTKQRPRPRGVRIASITDG